MKTLVIAPHPDDEVLGVGGTLLRRKSEGHSLAWLIVTGINEEHGWPQDKIERRDEEISRVHAFFKFDQVFNLRLPTTKLDSLPRGELVQKLSQCIHAFEPNEIFVPHVGDVHSDHNVVFQAAASCTKSFRYPFVKRILSYETLSETDFNLVSSTAFQPNVYFDISDFLDKKLEAMSIYNSEMGEFPFPRSRVSIESLARFRGSSSGFKAAEAFQLLRERL